MTEESFEVVPVAHVIGGRSEPTDDYWGGSRCIIRIDPNRFTPDATKGLEDFSHLEIVFRFHLPDPSDLDLGARRPRDNPAWPEVGTFGHRNMRRLNWLGVSRCKLVHVDELDLHVEELDAVHGTPILDIKPWFSAFSPRGAITEPGWTGAMLRDYYAPARGLVMGMPAALAFPPPWFIPTDQPACGEVIEFAAAETVDGRARIFTCDKPAGHEDDPDDIEDGARHRQVTDNTDGGTFSWNVQLPLPTERP